MDNVAKTGKSFLPFRDLPLSALRKWLKLRKNHVKQRHCSPLKVTTKSFRFTHYNGMCKNPKFAQAKPLATTSK